MRRFIFLVLSMLLAVSCSDSYLDGVLGRAEALMTEHPDSALLILQNVDGSGIGTRSGKARYSLDYAMALDKNWVDTTAVEIIQPALQYYHAPFHRKKRFLSHYYYARILENERSYPEALQAFSEAEHLFYPGIDSVYLVRLSSAKARIYTFQFINDKGEQALKEALRYSKELNDKENEQRMTEDSKLLLSNMGFLFGLYHPKFILALEDKGLSELETGYCCLFALGFTGKEIPDKLRRNTFYNTNCAIRRKIGLGPHDTNLSVWVQDLYKQSENLCNQS